MASSLSPAPPAAAGGAVWGRGAALLLAAPLATSPGGVGPNDSRKGRIPAPLPFAAAPPANGAMGKPPKLVLLPFGLAASSSLASSCPAAVAAPAPAAAAVVAPPPPCPRPNSGDDGVGEPSGVGAGDSAGCPLLPRAAAQPAVLSLPPLLGPVLPPPPPVRSSPLPKAVAVASAPDSRGGGGGGGGVRLRRLPLFTTTAPPPPASSASSLRRAWWSSIAMQSSLLPAAAGRRKRRIEAEK